MLQKIDERIQAAAKKNPALDRDHYQTLAASSSTPICASSRTRSRARRCGRSFSRGFANKETLAKFDQLAELRNGIRHSRTVDEVTRKEGEAALLWFEQVLGK